MNGEIVTDAKKGRFLHVK